MEFTHPRLTEEEMRRRFNEGRYWERMQAGEFTEHLIDTHKAQPGILERHPDAISVLTRYRDLTGNEIVQVHYYRLPDGSIIPGHKPDPKLLFEDGVMYHKEKQSARLKRIGGSSG